VTLLTGLLGSLAQAAPTFQNLDAPTLQQFLTMAQTFEDVGVSAYEGQIPLIQDKGILATVDGIQAIEGRHAGGLRAYRKLVSTAEGGDPNTMLTEDGQAVNSPRTMAQVLALVAPYIVGGTTTPTTPTTTTPTTTTPTTTTPTTTTGGTTGGTTTGTTGTTTGTTGATTGGTAGTGTIPSYYPEASPPGQPRLPRHPLCLPHLALLNALCCVRPRSLLLHPRRPFTPGWTTEFYHAQIWAKGVSAHLAGNGGAGWQDDYSS
jgi:hypothetical protein